MKKIILSLIFLINSIITFGQKEYSAFRTEIYEWKNEDWTLITENEDVTIPIYFLTRFIHIEAKKHGYFLLSRDDDKIISEKNFDGVRYNGYDLTIEEKCVIDIVDLKINRKKTIPVMSIIYSDRNINIRYYLKLEEKN